MSALAALAPVGLDELLAVAALQTRVDRKYLVPVALVPDLIAGLEDARVLDIDGERAFGYRSVYFDTPARQSYLGAARRRRHRFKVRTRAYTDTGGAWLEVKTKGGRGTTVKERVELADPSRLGTVGRAHADTLLRDGGIVGIDPAELEHTLATEYRRTTLLTPDGARATLDTELVWRGIEAGFATPGLAVVETKSGARAGVTDRMLWRHGVRPTSISKYGVGMAVLEPELPSNKWHRTLTEWFGADTRKDL